MLQRFVDPTAVAAEIERVRSLSGIALRRRWQAVFGRVAPEQLTADLLRRMIANRLQEEAFGTLDRATLKVLDGIGRRGSSRPAERNLKIGTVLVRDYRGRRHTVTVGPDGYVWEGQPYSSLSAIARAITGTAWSGPRFFADVDSVLAGIFAVPLDLSIKRSGPQRPWQASRCCSARFA